MRMARGGTSFPPSLQTRRAPGRTWSEEWPGRPTARSWRSLSPTTSFLSTSLASNGEIRSRSATNSSSSPPSHASCGPSRDQTRSCLAFRRGRSRWACSDPTSRPHYTRLTPTWCRAPPTWAAPPSSLVTSISASTASISTRRRVVWPIGSCAATRACRTRCRGARLCARPGLTRPSASTTRRAWCSSASTTPATRRRRSSPAPPSTRRARRLWSAPSTGSASSQSHTMARGQTAA
mmetsp:Transcript_29855/g.96346  ORF Transcript_29855/g.96346 Transcript_29855/m.96346 type:complete len:236 (-) Transcript_29855:4669-5376(-)